MIMSMAQEKDSATISIKKKINKSELKTLTQNNENEKQRNASYKSTKIPKTWNNLKHEKQSSSIMRNESPKFLITQQQILNILFALYINFAQQMFNKEFLKYQRLKGELERLQTLCPEQYFAVKKCTDQTCQNNKRHVPRIQYPCIHFYMGNCKYGFNCLFSHSIKRQIVKPEPAKETCRKLYYENYCPAGNKCKFSHDLRQYPCVFNSVGKCMYTDVNCRFSHQLKLDNPIICFFNLMNGCKNEQCENRHTVENVIKYISYEGAF